MVALLVLAALVLDLGTGYEHDTQLQAAADAAALAGAQQLITDPGSAGAMAQQYLANNVSPGDAQSSVKGGNVSQTIVPAARSVTVDLRENHVPFNFAQIIGSTEGAVSAHAKAELMYLTALPMVSPVAIPYLHPASFSIRTVTDNNSWFGGNSFNVNLTDPQSGGTSDAGTVHGKRREVAELGSHLRRAAHSDGRQRQRPHGPCQRGQLVRAFLVHLAHPERRSQSRAIWEAPARP